MLLRPTDAQPTIEDDARVPTRQRPIRYPNAWAAWASETSQTDDWREWIANLGTCMASDYGPLEGLLAEIDHGLAEVAITGVGVGQLSNEIVNAMCSVERFAVLVGFALARTQPANVEDFDRWFERARVLLRPDTWERPSDASADRHGR